MEKICPVCKCIFNKNSKHCSAKCYNSLPRYYQMGSLNVNYQNKSQGKPENKEKFLKAVKKRGQPWTEQHKKDHSLKMSKIMTR